MINEFSDGHIGVIRTSSHKCLLVLTNICMLPDVKMSVRVSVHSSIRE